MTKFTRSALNENTHDTDKDMKIN